MQTKQTTGLRTAANDYVTIVQQASDKVTGFLQLYKEMERSISITGKSRSTLTNYSRQLGQHIAIMQLTLMKFKTSFAINSFAVNMLASRKNDSLL